MKFNCRMLRAACICAGTVFFCNGASVLAQEALYANEFDLSQVRLLPGSSFHHACVLNENVLLSYDTDRLLAPYLKEARLPPKADSFPNWDGLDGHVGGHYLSALAIHYATTGHAELKRRMDYMVDELERCAAASGNGYAGGVPGGKDLWTAVHAGHRKRCGNGGCPGTMCTRHLPACATRGCMAAAIRPETVSRDVRLGY